MKKDVWKTLKIKVIGGGLAGCEAAWQIAKCGVEVELYEMRPYKKTGAHTTGNLAELVCSNSLGSNLANRASGLLKAELRVLGSLLIDCADKNALPAGNALAVDRDRFSECVQSKLEEHPLISIIREEITQFPEPPAILATGPLTSPHLSQAIQEFTGEDQLYFFDAIAPTVELDSINTNIAYRANRYDQEQPGEGDYLNCPLNKDQFINFRNALLSAERRPLKTFEEEIEDGIDAGKGLFFQGCQPIEIIARQGEKSMAFGPLRPVGLRNPHTGERPFAVVQLRQDNLAGDLYNLVGFQTNLLYSEQKRVFRMIPGLENASFARYGEMHRNAYLASPGLLNDDLSFKSRPGLFVAGQLAGIEGYAGNVASGLVAGLNVVRFLRNQSPLILPTTTMIGSIINYITHAELKQFQPIKAMFGLLPHLDAKKRFTKKERYKQYASRALEDLNILLNGVNHRICD